MLPPTHPPTHLLHAPQVNPAGTDRLTRLQRMARLMSSVLNNRDLTASDFGVGLWLVARAQQYRRAELWRLEQQGVSWLGSWSWEWGHGTRVCGVGRRA